MIRLAKRRAILHLAGWYLPFRGALVSVRRCRRIWSQHHSKLSKTKVPRSMNLPRRTNGRVSQKGGSRVHSLVLALVPLVLAVSIAVGSSGAPAQSLAAAPPPMVATDILGLDVFSTDGQQVGKVAKVNLIVADGKVRDIEVQSRGFLGYFSKTYLLPADKLHRKGGYVEVSMTSEQVTQFIK